MIHLNIARMQEISNVERFGRSNLSLDEMKKCQDQFFCKNC